MACKRVLPIILLAFAARSWATIAAVSTTPAGVINTTAGTSCANVQTASWGTSTTHTIVVVISTASARDSTIAVTDNATGGTNSYTKITSENASGGWDYLFYSVNIPRVNASGLVVTATWTTTARNSCAFKAYTGVVGASAAVTSTATSTSTTTPTIATTIRSAGAVIISGFSAANGSTTVAARSSFGALDASAASAGSTTPSTGIVRLAGVNAGDTVTTSLTWGTARTSGQTALELRDNLQAPTISPNGGSFSNDTAWTISTLDSPTVCWRTDGTNPAATTPGTCDASNNTSTSGTVTATGTTFKMLATKAGWTNSIITTATAFTLTAVAPTFGTNGGSFNNDSSTTLSSTTTSAVICYTTDGSTPAASTPGTCSAGSTYSGSVSITATGTVVKALATKANYVNSSVATSSAFTLTVGAVSSSPGAGTYGSTQTVTLSVATTTSATILYSVDGSAVSCPSTGTTYSTGISVAATAHVKAIGCKTNYVSSSAIDDLYTITVTPYIHTINGSSAVATVNGKAWGSTGIKTVNGVSTYAGGGGPSFGASAIIDNFNRTAEAPLSNGGKWTCPATWTSPWADATLSVGQYSNPNQVAADGGDSACYWNFANYGADVEAYVTFAGLNPNGSTSLCVRYNTTSNTGYCARVAYGASSGTNATWALFKDSTYNTPLVSTTRTVANGDSFGIEVIGTAIKVYHKASGTWTEVTALATTDATYSAAGRIVLGIQGGSSGIASDDDFGGGNR